MPFTMFNFNPSSIGKLSEAHGKVAIEWKIDDFFSFAEKDKSYRSPELYLLGATWEMEIIPFSEQTMTPGASVAIDLFLKEGQFSTIAEIEFGIKAGNGDIVNKCDYTWDTSKRDILCGLHSDIIKRSELERQKIDLVPSDTLTITCSIKQDNMPDCVASLKKLSADLKKMFISKRNCDVSLKVKDVTVPVHKNILATRSSVFAAMFEKEMHGEEGNLANIIDCDPDVFKDFLLYVYTGELDYSTCKIFGLYKIASKYKVRELQSACVDFMVCNLSLENFFESYVLGSQFYEVKLLEEVKKFFVKNFKTIVNLFEWNTFMREHTDEVHTLLLKMADNVKE